MKYLMMALLTLGAVQTVSAYEENANISETTINRIYDFFKGQGKAVYVAEYNGVNGISSIVSPSIQNQDLPAFRQQALTDFKAGKGVKFPNGAGVLAYDAQGKLLDISQFMKK
jgi:hypothetical protein